MGTNYRVVCDDWREFIDASNIGDGCNKAWAIAKTDNPIGPVVMFALLERWRESSVRIIPDWDNDWSSYTEVTGEVLEGYNSIYGTSLRFSADGVAT